MAKKLRYIFAKNMKIARLGMDLSQEKLGEMSNLHRTYIGAVERSEYNITIDNIEKIAKALKMKPDALLKE